MPLPQEIIDAIAKIMSHADRDELVAGLKDHAQPVFQAVYNKGHSDATARAKADRVTLETERDGLKTRAETAERERDELKSKQPDRATIDAQWQEKVRKLEEKHAGELKDRDTRIARLTTDTTVEKLEVAMRDAKLHPEYARLRAGEVAARIHYRDDGTPELYEEGTQIAVQIPSGKTVWQVAAEQAKEKAPSIFVLAGADAGGGAGSGGAGGSGGDAVATAAKRFQEQRDARPNPLKPKSQQTTTT